MRHAKVGGFIWFALGIALCIGSTKLGLGTLHNLGAGFAPFLFGSLLGLLGLMLTYQTIKKPEKKGIDEGISFKKLGGKNLYFLIVLMMYALLLELLGYIIVTFSCLFFLFKILKPQKWFTPILISLIAVILSYLIFCVWLKINFPKGIFNLG